MDIAREIRRIRFVELEIARRYPSDRIKSPVHLSLGAEWVSVAVCSALRPTDKVIGSYRSHALYLAKGGNLEAMLHELYGNHRGACRGLGGSMHLCDVAAGVLGSSAIVATHIPIAVGWARAGHRVVCFFGDGACDTGVFYESVNFAVLNNLPILFVCENNDLAVNTALNRRQRFAPVDRIEGMGIWTDSFDDTGMKELLGLMSDWSADPIPLFIQCDITRRCAHVGPEHDATLDADDFGDVRDEVLAAFAKIEAA